LRRQRSGCAEEVFPDPANNHRPCDDYSRRSALHASPRDGLRTGAPGDQRAHLAGTGGRPQCRREGEARRDAAVHEWHRRGPPALLAARPNRTASLALELAPARVTLIAPGFVDTPLSAAILGDQLDARRDQLRAKLPIRRVVGPADVAALAVHIMSNTALTGAT